MKPQKSQCLSAALLAALLLTPVVRAEQEKVVVPSPTVSPSLTPAPSPTPRLIPIALYFRRPAAVIPLHREEAKSAPPFRNFEIADETPWLTDADVRWVEYWPEDNPEFIRLPLTPEGLLKLSEARMGNVGRKVILVIDGTVRTVAALEDIKTDRKDRIVFAWAFPSGELERLQAQIARRPPPTPTPAPSPTPVKKERFIIR